ncbi:MAG: nucleoside recognition domain-containing protein [Limisphaerales bacterium]
MLNYIWLGLMVLAVVMGGLSGRLKEVTAGALDAAELAVMKTALPLIGLTALWLGLMRLAEQSGLIQTLAKALRPVMRRLFPEVPVDHPAMGSMLMNMAANMIGVTNAATPLGLRAMADLEKLNRHPGTATDAMCTFLALNTSSLQLIPTTAISILALADSANPVAIVGTTLLATACSTVVAVVAVKALARLPRFRLGPAPTAPEAATTEVDREEPTSVAVEPAPRAPVWWGLLALWGFVLLFAVLAVQAVTAPVADPDTSRFVQAMNGLSLLPIPFLLGFFPLYGAIRGVPVYEEFVEGAREGFQVVVRIIPPLVAILVAVGMFRAAGGVDLIAVGLRPVLDLVGFPADLLPMALTRPLSGSATIGLYRELVDTVGPDSLVARMGGTMLGSTETTFYVIAIYFGAVRVKRARHAVAAGLLAELAGIIASVVVCRMVFVG